MNEQYPTIALFIFTNIFIPLAAAWGGSMLALKKFKTEHLWQEKYTAYHEILNSIETMNLWAREIQGDSYMLPTIGCFDGENFYKVFADARRNISKHVCIGKLLISEDVREKLELLEQEIWDENYRAEEEAPGDPNQRQMAYGEHAEKILEIINKYLPDIVSFSKTDLQ